MIRTKLGLLSLCALVLGVMAVSAGSAQGAFSWLILDPNGTNLEVGTLLATLAAEKDSSDLSLLTELAGLNVIITCTNIALVNAKLEPGGKLTAGFKFVLTGCLVYGGPGVLEERMDECVVKSPGAPAETIESHELKGELVLHTPAGGGAEVQIKVEPKVGVVLKTIRIEGECALPEVNQLKGVLYLKDCEKLATTHSVKHLLELGSLTALYMGAHNANQLERTKIDGSFWVKLAGAHAGLSWSGMH